MANDAKPQSTNGSLKKHLGLFDVFVICTAAMFSSGFFLLPGIASAKAGPAVVLAYALSALLILPAMLSSAELATAMPRAGGAYYFIDRALGPLIGTVAGGGTWLALVLKSAFALVGMGAYLTYYADIPLKPLAVILTIIFGLLNVFGSKQSTKLLRVLVYFLLSILLLFLHSPSRIGTGFTASFELISKRRKSGFISLSDPR